MEHSILKIHHDGYSLAISVTVRRSGPDWIVCLHGLQSDKALFDAIFNLPFFDSYSILALDFVGFGDSSKPENFSYDIQDQTGVCKAVIQALGIQKFHLIGHSLGGMVGTLLLDELQSQIQSFVNMEGNLTLEDCGLSAEVSRYSFPEFQKRFPEIKSADYVFYKTSQTIVQWSASGKLLKIFSQSPVKKCFMYGDQNNAKVKKLTGVPLIKISHAGHFMLLDNPEECYEKVANFISS